MPELYDSPDALPDDFLDTFAAVPPPTSVMMCPPEYYDAAEISGLCPDLGGARVEFDLAQRQWEAVRDAVASRGVGVDVMDAAEGCEGMVFCAHHALTGADDAGDRLCVMSQMSRAWRDREVGAAARWYASRGFRVEHLPDDARFEGGADAIPHPGRGVLWGGYGPWTEYDAFDALSDFFEAPILCLALRRDGFDHLDTCFRPLDEHTALIVPSAFEPEGLALIRAMFERVLTCDEREARAGLACGVWSDGTGGVIADRGNPKTIHGLREAGYSVIEVETGEFLKSGAPVSAMVQPLFDASVSDADPEEPEPAD